MRLWTLHPRYLDARGLVALWREALLARAVIGGKTRGYRHHPQLHRFQRHASPRSAINTYLTSIFEEATTRGYSFDRSKLGRVRTSVPIPGTDGQLRYEWLHLKKKLRARSPADLRRLGSVTEPEANPLFQIEPGAVEPWERQNNARRAR